MAQYKTFTTCGDMGPWVSRLILSLPGFFHMDPLPERLPLVVWLHGAGEGQEPYRTVCGNKCVALGEPDIQDDLGGAAFVLAPSSPTWWVQADDDPVVRPVTHLWPAWKRLMAAGAKDAHLTCYDHVYDAAGNRLVGHFVWVQTYNDEPKTEIDGSLVLWDGFPVTIWQWLGKHSLA